MKNNHPFSIIFFVIFAIIGAAACFGQVSESSNPSSFDFLMNFRSGINLDFGGILHVHGHGTSYYVFGDSDYFEGIGRYHVMPSQSLGANLVFRFDRRNDVSIGLGVENKALRFEFIKKNAPTDLAYSSDFRYLTYSVSYTRFFGEKNRYLGFGYRCNDLFFNDSRIDFDGNEYLSVLDGAVDSQSFQLFFGRRYQRVQGNEMDARLGFYFDTQATYPLNNNGPIAMLFFMGLTFDLSWSKTIFSN
jgi:hypothetical protein